MFKGKKMAASFSSLKPGLHIRRLYLNVNKPSFISLKNGASGIGEGLAYTEGSKSLSSALLLNRRFFTPQLRSIAKAVVQAVTGVWVSVTTQPSEAVRDPHLNRWISKSKTSGGLK